MKLRPVSSPPGRLVSGPRRRQDGVAVVVVLALLAILMVFVAGNLRALYCLSAELRLVEKQQKQRLQAAVPGGNARTNAVPRSQDRMGRSP